MLAELDEELDALVVVFVLVVASKASLVVLVLVLSVDVLSSAPVVLP